MDQRSVALGHHAGKYNASGENTFIGCGAGKCDRSQFATFVGNNAGICACTGVCNVFIGAYTGQGREEEPLENIIPLLEQRQVDVFFWLL